MRVGWFWEGEIKCDRGCVLRVVVDRIYAGLHNVEGAQNAEYMAKHGGIALEALL